MHEIKKLRPMRWSRFRQLGNSRIVRSSYFWIIAVPIAAKFAPILQDVISNYLYHEPGQVLITLPFSWHLFYFSAIFFALGSWVFSLWCPWFVREFRDPHDFLESGRTEANFAVYAEYIGSVLNKNMSMEVKQHSPWVPYAINEITEMEELSEEKALAIEFQRKWWALFDISEIRAPIARAAVAVCYAIGLVLFFYIIIENFLFVVQSFVSSFH